MPVLDTHTHTGRGVASRTHVRTCFHVSQKITKYPLQTVARGCADMFIAFGNENVIIHLEQFVNISTTLYYVSKHLCTEQTASAACRVSWQCTRNELKLQD